MPTLHGYRERIPLNIYDAVSPRQFEYVPARPGADPVEHFQARPFRQAQHIGDLALTNLQIPGCWSSDQTLFLRGWRARTNITADQGFDWRVWAAWTHATTATFVLGCAPIVSVSLYDLLLRRQSRPDGEPVLEPLACQLRSAAGEDEPLEAWSSEARAKWLGVARAALRELGAPHLAIVPIRQHFHVDLRSDARAHRALLEVLPTNVAPQSLVWVHLEGVAVREAC